MYYLITSFREQLIDVFNIFLSVPVSIYFPFLVLLEVALSGPGDVALEGVAFGDGCGPGGVVPESVACGAGCGPGGAALEDVDCGSGCGPSNCRYFLFR